MYCDYKETFASNSLIPYLISFVMLSDLKMMIGKREIKCATQLHAVIAVTMGANFMYLLLDGNHRPHLQVGGAWG